ncbi:MAG: DUF2252 family protein [Myxococcota bacterium]
MERNDRSAFLESTMAEADRVLIRSRPVHAAGKYARMARSLYDFYRGSVPVFSADFANGSLPASASEFSLNAPLVLSTGDAHPENFGLLLATDGSLALEPNDFDSADRYPYLWDVRRLTTGLVLAARLANPEDEAARMQSAAAASDIARAAAVSYTATVRSRVRIRYDEAFRDASPHLTDLYRRGERDRERIDELNELTEVVDGARVLRRGVVAEDDPENLFQDLPKEPFEALTPTLLEYRSSLLAPPPPEYFTVLDAARELGSGVASWPRIRVLILVRGPTDAADDDVILELKELVDSAAQGWVRPRRYHDTVGDRLLETSRALWARPDAEPLWGEGMWLGMPVQIRRESEAQKTLRVRRMEGELGTVQGLTELATILGAVLARMHMTPQVVGGNDLNVAEAIDAVIGDRAEAFADEQAAQAIAYANQVEADWILWREIVRRDPTLGLPLNVNDQPRDEVRGILGVPATPAIP